MFFFWKRLFRKKPMGPKDPMDFRLTENSREWWTSTYCPHCKKATGHHEQMAGICNGCGGFGDMGRYRSSREIWDGEKWVIQRKYGNRPADCVVESH